MIDTPIESANTQFLTAVQAASLPETPARELSNDAEHPSDFARHRLVPLLCWAAVVITLVLIPLKIISYGYLPPDDALRHAAKAVSGRDWTDILVLQDQFKMDHNPGWHWLLTAAHHLTGANAEGLVLFSVSSLVLLFCFVPLRWFRYPEAWIATLLLSMIFFPGMLLRIFLGRPFALSVTITLVLLLLWRQREKASARLMAGSAVLFALGTWLHGSWYLFVLIPTAFALSGQWNAAFRLAGCWLAGSLLGASLTGHPIGFLWNAINIGINCFGHNQLQGMLVSEFLPGDGAPFSLLAAAALLIVRAASGNWTWKAVNNPVFILFLLGWILGFRVVRFHDDWALPALGLWTALELHEYFPRYLAMDSLRRLVITSGLCAALFFAVTGDRNGRWTNNLKTEYLSEKDPEMKPWLPEDGGIIYHADMSLFYQTFFKNPHAKWKYILGFESTFMPPDDLRIFRNIQWNDYAHKAYEPWVAKMHPQDRMIITGSSTSAPAVPGLEWKYVARQIWIGRLPRPTAPIAAPVDPLPAQPNAPAKAQAH